MKNTIRETLKLAIDRLFVRVHESFLEEIYMSNMENFNTAFFFDENNESHIKLVQLCKEKVGFQAIMTKQDIFFSIMKVYVDVKIMQE